MARPTPFQLLRDGLMDFVARETELAKAELVPAAKQAGFGSAFVAAAVTFLLHSLWMLVIVLALALSWLMSLTGLNTVGCLTLGFLAAALLSTGTGEEADGLVDMADGSVRQERPCGKGPGRRPCGHGTG